MVNLKKLLIKGFFKLRILFPMPVAGELKQCNLDSAGFITVRYSESKDFWFKANDNLFGWAEPYYLTSPDNQWNIFF